MAYTLTARWLFPVDGPPLEQGTITIQDESIRAVEPHGQRRPDRDLGRVAILPGLVNAHTHLDLCGMRGLCPPGADFPAWLRAVIDHRRQRTTEQIEADVRAGLAECQRQGTTLLGDISGLGLSWPILERAGVRSVVFLELLGLPEDRARRAYQQAVDWLSDAPAVRAGSVSDGPSTRAGNVSDGPRSRKGLSPHAPYSVRADLFRQLADLVNHFSEQGREIPVAIHLAETPQELELLADRSGPLAEFLKGLGVYDPQGLVSSPAEICRLFEATPRTLFVHANYLETTALGGSGPSLTLPARTVVYCPRTHAAFGHAPHPFRNFLAQGVCVALGTDSLASNPDLSILAEARFLHRLHPDFPLDVLLRMVTLNGAIALGWQHATGSLRPGKSADLIVVPLPADDRADDPHQLIFDSDHSVQRTMCRGSWLEPPNNASAGG